MLSNWFKWLIRRLLIKNTTQNEILEIEIKEHQNSEKVSMMKEAYNYYRNRTDIRNKKVDVDWRTNSRIELGLFKKLVDQKVGYLFSKQPTISLGGEESQDFLDSVFDEDLLSTIKSLGKEAVMKGIAYGLPYYDGQVHASNSIHYPRRPRGIFITLTQTVHGFLILGRKFL